MALKGRWRLRVEGDSVKGGWGGVEGEGERGHGV